MNEQKKPTVRLDPDLHQNAKVLVGYFGHRSIEGLVNSALKFYLDQFKPDIERIKKQAKRPRN